MITAGAFKAEYRIDPKQHPTEYKAFCAGMKAMARLVLEVGDHKCPACGGSIKQYPGGIVCEHGCSFLLPVDEAKTKCTWRLSNES